MESLKSDRMGGGMANGRKEWKMTKELEVTDEQRFKLKSYRDYCRRWKGK